MVYTVTINPSLDYTLRLDSLQIGGCNRPTQEEKRAGGKGLNVAIILNRLGVETIATGFIAGMVGEWIERDANAQGCRTDFIRIKGESRINVKILAEEETEINGQGPEISVEDMKRLQQKLNQLQDGDALVLAGSVPQNTSPHTYAEIMANLKNTNKNIRIVVDATNQLLLNTLPHRPFLIKPNKKELGETFGVEINIHEDMLQYAKELTHLGARNVLVSLGSEGAVLLAEDGSVYKRHAPQGRVVNSVGAGDTMVAGFLAEYIQTEDYAKALRMGIAAAGASTFSLGLATKKDVQAWLERCPEEDS